MCGRVVVLCAVDGGRDMYTTTQPTTTAKIKFSLPLYTCRNGFNALQGQCVDYMCQNSDV